MDSDCRKALQILEENDPVLTELRVVDWKGMPSKPSIHTGQFNSTNSNHYARLGEAIAMNTHLTKLHVNNETILDVSERGFDGFYDGLKRNSSIIDVSFSCDRRNLVGSVYHDILNAYQYQGNISRLAYLRFDNANLNNGGEHLIASTLQRCANVAGICLFNCNITDQRLLTIVEAVKTCRSLEKLELSVTSIGRTVYSCDVLAGLLSDANCNLESLALRNNEIDNEGALVIANSLSNNTKLQNLDLYNNRFDAAASFSRLVCDTSSINSTYFSNHTLAGLGRHVLLLSELESLLDMNKNINKSHVAIKKILKYHPIFDMEPFFQLGTEDDERNLKALSYLIDWFDKAGAAVDDEDDSSVSDSEEEESHYYYVEERKLSAIYQFSRSMPLQFVPASHIKGFNKKRKRNW